MKFNIDKSVEILSRTPNVLRTLLHKLSEDWSLNNEGPNTWSPYDVIGHLIHGEKTDWIPRAQIILSNQEDKTFTPFDRFAQTNDSKGKTLDMLLSEFEKLRKENIDILKGMKLDSDKLQQKGIHPELGEVKLVELLSTWVVHDLGHISQISRVMSKQYATEVGVWKAYLSILKA